MAGPRTGTGTMLPAPSGRQGSGVEAPPTAVAADPMGATAGLIDVTTDPIDVTDRQTVAVRPVGVRALLSVGAPQSVALARPGRGAAVTSVLVTDEAAETLDRPDPISAPGQGGRRSRRSLRVSSPPISTVPHGRGCARCPRTTRRAWRAIS